MSRAVLIPKNSYFPEYSWLKRHLFRNFFNLWTILLTYIIANTDVINYRKIQCQKIVSEKNLLHFVYEKKMKKFEFFLEIMIFHDRFICFRICSRRIFLTNTSNYNRVSKKNQKSRTIFVLAIFTDLLSIIFFENSISYKIAITLFRKHLLI